jgi:hypothetical protein
VTLTVAAPDADDSLIARYGDAERLRWTRDNFAAHDRGEEPAAHAVRRAGCSTTGVPVAII